MLVLAGGDVVLPDRVVPAASLIIDGGRIVAIEASARLDPAGATTARADGCYVVPGFLDVHVHGVSGHDTLGDGDAVAAIAAMLPRFGVTSFCPTTVACPPAALRRVLEQVASLRAARPAGSARVLPAHLESNFINPEYRGAQPAECLRRPPSATEGIRPSHMGPSGRGAASEGEFSGRDILDVIASVRPSVGIVTLAPELPGSIELVTALAAEGHRVSIGHSGASLDEAVAAIEAGARHATHLFNRMSPMTHRAPGIAGAVLSRDEVGAELICDGYHVHGSMCRIAIAAKGIGRVMAITDGTAGSGLPVGSSATLGGRHIRVTDQAAVLDDGTLAGSTLTMDRAFATIVNRFERSVSDASVLCSTTPAQQLGLNGVGVIAEGAYADLVVLDRDFRVVRTLIDGEEVYRSGAVA
jgi:N-acetylglucosamine-6-phosphate deacetylase